VQPKIASDLQVMSKIVHNSTRRIVFFIGGRLRKLTAC
jgi:hypothetical protein